jgi:hypothetical protein
MGEGQEDSVGSNGYSTGYASSTDAMETDTTKDVEKAMRNKLIEQEEKAVKRARLVVIIALVISAIAVSVSTCLFAKQSDIESFKLAVSGMCKLLSKTTLNHAKPQQKKTINSHFFLPHVRLYMYSTRYISSFKDMRPISLLLCNLMCSTTLPLCNKSVRPLRWQLDLMAKRFPL